MLAIQHCTPYGIFSLELSVSDGFEEAEISLANAQNRDFFDYLVGTDEDFFPMCVLFAKCTEIAATKRKKQLLEKIAELRQNRQDLIGMNEIQFNFVITSDVSLVLLFQTLPLSVKLTNNPKRSLTDFPLYSISLTYRFVIFYI
jgi:hypothetical protein